VCRPKRVSVGRAFVMDWVGNIRYPPQDMSDLSDREWLAALRERYGEENICFYHPKAGGAPWRAAAEWEARGLVGVYLK
jgi:hypothetical protein